MTHTQRDGDLVDVGDDGRARCSWGGATPLYRAYHDHEWGRPVVSDSRLFEKLSLEGFQAGLSWLTILRKRDAFRAAFAGFDAPTVATYTSDDVDRLLTDAAIVRHRGKIESTINNAARTAEIVAEFGSLAAYAWNFEPEPDLRPRRVTHEWLLGHSTSAESVAMSRDLKNRGWSFVGPTTVYAFMQAMGLVNDHQESCFVRTDVELDRQALERPAANATGGR